MKKVNILRLIIGIVGLIFIILGVTQGEYHDTLMKAIRVCLECIGIG